MQPSRPHRSHVFLFSFDVSQVLHTNADDRLPLASLGRVESRNGIVESRDGGASWAAPIPLPKELKGVSDLSWMEYDPVHDLLYAMKMGSQLFQFKLDRKAGK